MCESRVLRNRSSRSAGERSRLRRQNSRSQLAPSRRVQNDSHLAGSVVRIRLALCLKRDLVCCTVSAHIELAPGRWAAEGQGVLMRSSVSRRCCRISSSRSLSQRSSSSKSSTLRSSCARLVSSYFRSFLDMRPNSSSSDTTRNATRTAICNISQERRRDAAIHLLIHSAGQLEFVFKVKEREVRACLSNALLA